MLIDGCNLPHSNPKIIYLFKAASFTARSDLRYAFL